MNRDFHIGMQTFKSTQQHGAWLLHSLRYNVVWSTVMNALPKIGHHAKNHQLLKFGAPHLWWKFDDRYAKSNPYIPILQTKPQTCWRSFEQMLMSRVRFWRYAPCDRQRHIHYAMPTKQLSNPWLSELRAQIFPLPPNLPMQCHQTMFCLMPRSSTMSHARFL